MAHIEVIGLGPSTLTHLRYDVWQILEQLRATQQTLYVRTVDHPAVQELIAQGWNVCGFDAVYEAHAQFDAVYKDIVAQLHQQAQRQQRIVYAVPGHPMVAEQTVQLLLQHSDTVPCRVVGGTSFLDDLFQTLGIDPVTGCQLLDAHSIHPDRIDVRQQLVVMQVYDAFVAGDVKLALLTHYPPEHRVARVSGAGSAAESVTWCPLHELDHQLALDNLLSVYVPPLEREQAMSSLATTQEYMDAIAAKDIWLQAHHHQQLVPYLMEEAAEVAEAIANQDIDNLVEELGDLLLQVLYHAAIGERDGYFSLEDIVTSLNRKLYRRHPHVFGDRHVSSLEELRELWLAIKEKEKSDEIG